MEPGEPILHRRIDIPRSFLTDERVEVDGRVHTFTFGGDVRMGDLDGDGRVEFICFRSLGGTKPCFVGAFDMDGRALWSYGHDGDQPLRPGPVAVYDIDGDGRDEVIAAFADVSSGADPTSCEDVRFVVLDGRSGAVRLEAVVDEILSCGEQFQPSARIQIADFRGLDRPSDFIIRTGRQYTALAADFSVLWTYRIPAEWTEYGRAPAYVPSVGDIDGDGRDEVNGGYFLLDHDGTPLWENSIAPHCDSVAIAAWTQGVVSAFCSGHGHVLDQRGAVITRLGEELVPHGQEVRVAHFLDEEAGNQMVIRCHGHKPDVICVGARGDLISSFALNHTTNDTGMEAVYWYGPKEGALLCNGDRLWRATGQMSHILPGMPGVIGNPQRLRMSWYHCIPADVCGDDREEVVLYNPWNSFISIYTPAPLAEEAYRGYRAGLRQYNVRLMN